MEIAPTICSKTSNRLLSDCPIDSERGSSICEVVFYHQPFISNTKHIIKNNCTISQEFDATDNAIPNNNVQVFKLDPVVPNFDHMANTGSLHGMDPARLADLESQIIVEIDDKEDDNNKKQIVNKVEIVTPEVSTSADHADSTLGK